MFPVDSLDDTIHGDHFANMCAVSWNDRWKRLEGIEKGGLIFCKTDYIHSLWPMLNPSVSYALITHNSDHNIDVDRYAGKPDNVVLWFAQNAVISRSDLYPIPIGLERPGVAGSGNIEDFRSATSRGVPRNGLAYCNIEIGTNKIREPIRAHYLTTDWCKVPMARQGFREYLDELCSHKAIISPPGNGSDCHRTWEAMACGAVPVCSGLTHNMIFGRILPMIIMDVMPSGTLMQEELERVRHRLEHNAYTLNALTFSWWRDFIYHECKMRGISWGK